jgi:hypothetical protein
MDGTFPYLQRVGKPSLRKKLESVPSVPRPWFPPLSLVSRKIQLSEGTRKAGAPEDQNPA